MNWKSFVVFATTSIVLFANCHENIKAPSGIVTKELLDSLVKTKYNWSDFNWKEYAANISRGIVKAVPQENVTYGVIQQEEENIIVRERRTVKDENEPNKTPYRFQNLQVYRRYKRQARTQSTAQLLPSSRNYQACVTPLGAKGHCRHIRYCPLPGLKEDFLKFVDYICIIEGETVGICCPDDLAGAGFAQALPARGDQMAAWEMPTDRDPNARIVSRPEERGCGLATKQFPKITGGRPSDPGEWPWMAALISVIPDQALCGGVLITDRHVLTAAHCTMRMSARELKIRLGEYDFTKSNETRSRDFAVIEIRQHIDFDMTTYENDVAIVKIQRPTLFNSYIWPICMPPIDEDWAGYNGVVIGWGTQFFGGPHAKVLMEVAIPIWRNPQCQEVYANRIFDTTICAGSPAGGHDSCQGDSGGPLMVQLPNKRWVVAGVVSWGVRCGEANHPGIYTRVGSYVRWILENCVF